MMEQPVTDLCKMALKYGTDKWGFHYYTETYDSFFKDRRADVKKVLEIGIGDPSSMARVPGQRHLPYEPGASLRMWEEYFPNATVYALDTNTSLFINTGRIRSFYCDQGSEGSLREAMGQLGDGFDLIVDDGSHVPEHQALSAKLLVPLLAPGGVYIVEDVWPFPSEVGWSKEPFGLKVSDIPFPAEIVYCRGGGDNHLVVIRA